MKWALFRARSAKNNGLGDMSFQFGKRMWWGAFLLAALASSITSNKAIATPVIPPGDTAALFDVNIDAGYNKITNIASFTITTTSTGVGKFYTASPGANEFVTPIPPQAGAIQSAFAAGVIAGLPSDPAGVVTNHLVVFGDFTPAELNMSFASLFSNISESTLINDLLTTPAGQQLPFLDVKAFTADAKTDGLYGGNGSEFDAAAFSTGTVIGNGTLTFLPINSVPEPLSLSLFGAGLAGAAALRRRRKTQKV